MMSGKTQGQQQPTAFGTMLQAATYGMTIPSIYGTTRSSLLAIWARNLRAGGGSKKGKKKGTQSFVENIDFLIGANPIEACLQMWNNSKKYGLDFKVYRVDATGLATVTIPDSNFYKLIAVVAEASLVSPIVFNCFGAPGTITFTGGGGSTIPGAGTLAAGPQYVPIGDSFSGIGPNISIPALPPSEWVFGRIRGPGLSVWHNPPTGRFFMIPAGLADVCVAAAGLSPYMTIGTVIGNCTCGGSTIVPGLSIPGGCVGNPAILEGDGQGQVPGSIQTLATGGIQYDMEALGFNVTNNSGYNIGTPCAWTGSGPIGPCDGGLGGPTFPGPGTPPYTNGHNLADAGGGEIYMIEALPTSPAAGAPLYIAVISGAGPIPGLRPLAPGWTLVQQGANILVFISSGNTPGEAAIPLWNAAQHGPDLIDPNYVRQSNYKWDSNLDAATIELLDVQSANPPGSPIWAWNGFLDFYYAALNESTRFNPPCVANHLTFEPQLGDGPEYAGSGFEAEQIVYPPYAGLGSPNIDLGAGGILPSIYGEFKGTFAKIAPRGDAEFADMIEDVIKSGQLQLGAQLGQIQRGVNANELPGPVQKNFIQYSPAAVINLPYRSANVKSDMLVAFARTGAGTPTISDTPGANAWTAIYAAGDMGFWYTAGGANAALAGNIVSFGSALEGYIIEMDPGSTATDSAPYHNNGTGAGPITGQITVTNAQGQTYILGMLVDDSGTFGPLPIHWNQPMFSRANVSGALGAAHATAFYRIVNGAGTYKISIPRSGSGNWGLVLIAFIAAQPVPYPKALGKIVDDTTLQTVRDQCIANSLWGSVDMNAQKAAADWLAEMYQCANADPVWSGFRLKSIARSEVPMVANGAVYTPPTCSGPVAHLMESDMVGDASTPMVKVTRKAQVDANNVVQYQYFDRNADYNQSTAGEPLAGATALFGPRKQAPTVLPEIQDPLVARKLLAIEVRRYSVLRNVYEFTLQPRWLGLESRDLIAIDDRFLGFNALPVRLNKIEEQEDHSLKCEAEDFVYGANDPTDLPATTGSVVDNTGPDPGTVNPPIIFEPVPRLFAQQNQGQVWAVVSGSSPNYGGAVVLISTDGGASYNPVGNIAGSAVMGKTNADWPAGADPDTTHNLLTNVSESNGTMNDLAIPDQDSFLIPVYVGGGLTCIPYELMTYGIATLLGVGQYELMATGGGTNHLRRAVFGAPQVGAGVDHPAMSDFAVLNPNSLGIFKINLDPAWIGQTIFFKFLAVNIQNSFTQPEADATAYSFTPTGCPSNTGGSGVTNSSVAVAVAPGAAGNFTVAHGLGAVPKFAIVQMTSGGKVWFQSALRYDATNLYLVASDAGITANIICWTVVPDAEVALAPGAPGNFNAAHGLGIVPALVFVQMTSGGAIWLQTPDADVTNIKLTASDTGLTGFAEAFKPAPQATKIAFGELMAAPTAPGTFSIPHNLGVIPKLAVVRETSGGDIWLQPVRYDINNVYLVASDTGVTALVDVWG